LFRIRDFSGETPWLQSGADHALVLEVESEFKWKTEEEAEDIYKNFPIKYPAAE
jgi:hypothetical protein